jgi:Ca2+-binding RTX toxin-like protein
VVFESDATNLVAGDTNGVSDIFLKDLSTGAITRLSTAANGAQTDFDSYTPLFSPDGRHVMFESDATNLVAGDTNNKTDIFRIDLLYKANAAAIIEGRFIETTLGVGNASSVSIAWGDGTSSTQAPVAGQVSLNHAYASTGAKNAVVTLVEGALTWNVAHTVDLGTGTMVRNTALADTLSGGAGNDILTGDAFANILNGAGGNDWLDGGAGADVMDGGSGDDTYVADGTDTIVEALGGGTDTVITSSNFSLATFAQVENLTAADGAAGVMLTGNALANTLMGNAGANRLDGGAGADVLNGGGGDDVYLTDGADTIIEAAGGGLDTVLAISSFSLAGIAQVENLKALDGTGSVMLAGNGLANVLTGAGGNDRLDGGAGADTLNGGGGDDVYVTDAADTVIEAAGGGTDTVLASGYFSLAAFAQVENLMAADGTARLTLTGNGLANILTGNAGVNTLSGGAGNDRLIGGLGQDSLTGGSGKDVFAFDDRETSASRSKADTILDFSRRQSDRIDLSAIDANTRKRGDQKFSFIGDEKSFSKAGEMRFEKTKSATYIYLNTDNDRSAEAVIKIKGALDLQKGWFVL